MILFVPSTKTLINITDLERDMLLAYPKSNYGEAPEHWTWTFDVVDKSGIAPRKARGVLSSLTKKGLIASGGEVTSEGESDTYLTVAGQEILKMLLASGEQIVNSLKVDEAKELARALHNRFGITVTELGQINVPSQSETMTEYEKELCEAGRWLEAIKYNHSRLKHAGMTLRGAKDVIDDYRNKIGK